MPQVPKSNLLQRITANQVVLTYTVTSGKTLFLEWVTVQSRLGVISATASILGNANIETPSGTAVSSFTFVNPTTSDLPPTSASINFPEPIPISAGVVIRVVCTPQAATSMNWVANLGGYEK